MNNNIFETIKKELRAIIRDRKSLLMMLLTPIMIPIFVFLFSFVYDNLVNQDDIEEYNVGINYKLSDIEEKIIKELNFTTIYYEDKEKLQEAYEKGKISSYVILNDDKYNIYANEMTEKSKISSTLVTAYLDNYNTYIAQNYLTSINVDLDKVYHNINYSYEKIVDGNNDLVNIIINFAFIFSIMSITLCAIYSATDSTAGEKERGTLETILTFPIKNNELIIGKYLAISISCIFTSIISIVLAVVSLSICKQMFEIYNDTIFNFNFITITLSFLIMVSYSMFISGLCIAISSFSKTYKEAQSALTPISMITMVPMFFDILEVSINPIISLIPIVNHTLLINEIFCGNINIVNILIMFISTIIYVVILIKVITKLYKKEKILFSI